MSLSWHLSYMYSGYTTLYPLFDTRSDCSVCKVAESFLISAHDNSRFSQSFHFPWPFSKGDDEHRAAWKNKAQQSEETNKIWGYNIPVKSRDNVIPLVSEKFK